MKYLNYTEEKVNNPNILGKGCCFVDKATQETPAKLIMVKDLNEEVSNFLEKEIFPLSIVLSHFENYSIIGVSEEYYHEVCLLLTYLKKKFAIFDSYEEYSDFTVKLDDLI